ncbi:tRNA pseudouridine synthase B [Sulfuriferula multivorans]|uniref:tRNA pseudouridine synthase B n=1 Tax=Sulfuriferula multivorans TaxID=1559896 RepID=A0A401JG75_9PROT|nr:tRNA pseudouridine(55) synthase TruB [Sulfuriferula multivorans]GBL46641.1 tRNA pseudouridine synthase B [Sulfuriferula multivorans]
MQFKRIKRAVNGVLLLNKPVGITSNAALQIAKRLFQAEKAGHTGTLDPFANGLLPLCLGEATKFAQYLLDADKVYRAVIQLGVTTTTGDPEGEVLDTRPVNVTRTDLNAVIARFIGTIEQTPPMYSALKHQGKPLYEYARAGIEIERKSRSIHIHAIELCALDGSQATINVRCSAGTYIRTLAEDIGKALGCGAHLTELARTASGGFHLDQAVSLATLENTDITARDQLLLPVDGLVTYLPRIELNDTESAALLKGQRQILSAYMQLTGLVRAYDSQHRFLGLVELQPDGLAIARRLMASNLPCVQNSAQ